MLNNIFTTILDMSFSAGIIAIVVIVLRLIIKNRIPKTFILILWAIVFIKLALPLAIPSPTSIFNTLPVMQTIQKVIVHPRAAVDVSDNQTQNNIMKPVKGNTTPILTQTVKATPTAVQKSALTLDNVLPIIWLCITFSLLMFFIINYIVVFLRFKKVIILNNELIQKFIDQYKLKRKVRIYKSTSVNTPVVFGVLRPKIILPYNFNIENETALKHILTHEMQHIKRFDNLTNLIVLLILCLHWFNPIIWLSKILLFTQRRTAKPWDFTHILLRIWRIFGQVKNKEDIKI